MNSNESEPYPLGPLAKVVDNTGVNGDGGGDVLPLLYEE